MAQENAMEAITIYCNPSLADEPHKEAYTKIQNAISSKQVKDDIMSLECRWEDFTE